MAASVSVTAGTLEGRSSNLLRMSGMLFLAACGTENLTVSAGSGRARSFSVPRIITVHIKSGGPGIYVRAARERRVPGSGPIHRSSLLGTMTFGPADLGPSSLGGPMAGGHSRSVCEASEGAGPQEPLG
jgi:hypothetical protein